MGKQTEIQSFLHYLKTVKRYRLPKMGKLVEDINDYRKAGGFEYSNTDRIMKDKQYLYTMYNATSSDDGTGELETYENWLERQLLSRIDRLEKLEQENCPQPQNSDSNISEDQIKELGWMLVEEYEHDRYKTNRYQLGCMLIEFTYEDTELMCCDVTISELNCMPISFNQAKLLTELFRHWSE